MADRGYFKAADIEACEQAGMVPYGPRPQRGPSVRTGRFRKDEFEYEEASDSYLCPARQRLTLRAVTSQRDLKRLHDANRLVCEGCALRPRCTAGSFRIVTRLENEAVLDRMQTRLAKRPDILGTRRETVEHPFGSIKQWMHQGAFRHCQFNQYRNNFRQLPSKAMKSRAPDGSLTWPQMKEYCALARRGNLV